MVVSLKINGINYSLRVPAETVSYFTTANAKLTRVTFVMKRRGESIEEARDKAARLSQGAPLTDVTSTAQPLNLLQFGVDADLDDVFELDFVPGAAPNEPAVLRLKDSAALQAIMGAGAYDSELASHLRREALQSLVVGGEKENT